VVGNPALKVVGEEQAAAIGRTTVGMREPLLGLTAVSHWRTNNSANHNNAVARLWGRSHPQRSADNAAEFTSYD
jgi:hypothetical protein